jgi:hypothetical protein
VTGTYTITAPQPPAPVFTIAVNSSGYTCWNGGSPGCYLNVTVTGSGYTPNGGALAVNTIFSGVIVGAAGVTTENITTAPPLVLTGATGSFTDALVGVTPLIPVAGGPYPVTITVTIQGVTNTFQEQYTDS